jgi:hypothetical protein
MEEGRRHLQNRTDLYIEKDLQKSIGTFLFLRIYTCTISWKWVERHLKNRLDIKHKSFTSPYLYLARIFSLPMGGECTMVRKRKKKIKLKNTRNFAQDSDANNSSPIVPGSIESICHLNRAKHINL